MTDYTTEDWNNAWAMPLPDLAREVARLAADCRGIDKCILIVATDCIRALAVERNR
jgi:hypothetical protein